MGTRAAARARPLPWAFALCPSFVNACSLFGEILTSKSAASILQLLLKVARLLKHNKVYSFSGATPPVPTDFPWGCVWPSIFVLCRPTLSAA